MAFYRKLFHQHRIWITAKVYSPSKIQNHAREMAVNLTKLSLRQIETHASLRFLNIIKYPSYNKSLWGDKVLGTLLHYKHLFSSVGRKFLCGAPLLVYDWKKYNITDQKIHECLEELDTVNSLCLSTLYCARCQKRQVIDQITKGIEYCQCNGSLGYTQQSEDQQQWEPFLERENIFVWRKKHEDFPNLYCYKVYGSYTELSVSAFLETQLNASFRTVWDSLALKLELVASCKETHSDLIYWLVKFPRFFSNRDYVYKRRFHVYDKSKRVVVYSEATSHDQLPDVPGVHRVKDYWAKMVIQANEDFDLPGLCYTLTYFDNPGTTLPSAVTNLIATRSFPDFLAKVHTAAMNLQTKRTQGEDIYLTLPDRLRYGKSYVLDEITETDVNSKDINIDQIAISEQAVSSLKGYEVTIANPISLSSFGQKLEKVLLALGNLKNDRSLPFSDWQSLQEAVVGLLKKGALMRQESLARMKKFEANKRHYDHSNYDELTQLLITKFFISIHEVLEADKDIRTGRGFLPMKRRKYTFQDSDDYSSSTHRMSYSPKDILPVRMKSYPYLNSSTGYSSPLQYLYVDTPDPIYWLSSHLLNSLVISKQYLQLPWNLKSILGTNSIGTSVPCNRILSVEPSCTNSQSINQSCNIANQQLSKQAEPWSLSVVKVSCGLILLMFNYLGSGQM